MDLALPGGSATVVATIDGAASVYTSTGGGIIGGEAHEAVRTAARQFVTAMEACFAQLSPGAPELLPQPGHVRFYAKSKTLSVSSPVPERDVADPKHPLHACYVAAQEVVTQLRLAQPAA
jgi:hypothetical protein